MRDKGLGLDLEQLARQVVRRAIAGRAIVELARVLRGVGNQFLQRVGLHARGIDHHHLRRLGDHGDRDEILLDVVVELLVERRGDGMVRTADEDGIAVRHGLGRDAGTDRAAGAAAVVDHELLAQLLGQLRGQRARKGIGAAAGRERHDHGDGLGRPGIGMGRGCCEQRGGADAGHAQCHARGARARGQAELTTIHVAVSSLSFLWKVDLNCHEQALWHWLYCKVPIKMRGARRRACGGHPRDRTRVTAASRRYGRCAGCLHPGVPDCHPAPRARKGNSPSCRSSGFGLFATGRPPS
ncbi:hypothetical protein FQZ97_723360 [compost metagenome]